MKRSRTFITIIVLVFYILAEYFMPTFFTPKQDWLRILLNKIFPLLTVLLALLIIHGGKRNLLEAWGLRRGFGQGLWWAFLMTLPMLIGYGAANNFNIPVGFEHIFYGILIAPIFEELLYRGFLFGQLYRFGGWGYISAGLVNALIFGSLHLYQAHDFGSAMAVFAVTAMGGMWFAWLYIEWNDNLWISIFLHLFMNAWWIIFEIADNAAGGWYANIFRVLTIAASIVITIRMRKKEGGFRITKDKLWVNKKAEM